jgi:polysaccharide export outer membrane protein
MNKPLFTTLLLALLLGFTACNAPQKIAYFQQAGETGYTSPDESVHIPDPVIKVGDLLVITVNTNTPESAAPFNLPLVPSSVGIGDYNPMRSTITNFAGGLQNYLVDNRGIITLPTLGDLQVVGLTKTQLIEKIQQGIYPRYIKEIPIVLVRYANFNVSVLGEVARPGNFVLNKEIISIPEALALAGDLTIFGRRDNILLIRQLPDRRETIRLDLRDPGLIHSPHYFMQQNDVLYVQPNDPKSRSSELSTAETISISIVGTLISIATLIINILN